MLKKFVTYVSLFFQMSCGVNPSILKKLSIDETHPKKLTLELRQYSKGNVTLVFIDTSLINSKKYFSDVLSITQKIFEKSPDGIAIPEEITCSGQLIQVKEPQAFDPSLFPLNSRDLHEFADTLSEEKITQMLQTQFIQNIPCPKVYKCSAWGSLTCLNKVRVIPKNMEVVRNQEIEFDFSNLPIGEQILLSMILDNSHHEVGSKNPPMRDYLMATDEQGEIIISNIIKNIFVKKMANKLWNVIESQIRKGRQTILIPWQFFYMNQFYKLAEEQGFSHYKTHRIVASHCTAGSFFRNLPFSLQFAIATQFLCAHPDYIDRLTI